MWYITFVPRGALCRSSLVSGIVLMFSWGTMPRPRCLSIKTGLTKLLVIWRNDLLSWTLWLKKKWVMTKRVPSRQSNTIFDICKLLLNLEIDIIGNNDCNKWGTIRGRAKRNRIQIERPVPSGLHRHFRTKSCISTISLPWITKIWDPNERILKDYQENK